MKEVDSKLEVPLTRKNTIDKILESDGAWIDTQNTNYLCNY